MRLAAAPISWGISEVPGWGFQLDRDHMLRDAVRLGLRDIEAGPPGFLPADAGEANDLAHRHGVNVIGGFVTAVLHRPERLEAELSAVDKKAAWLSALGAEVLVLAAASGRDGYDAPAVLTEHEWKILLAALPRVVEIARAHSLDTALHPARPPQGRRRRSRRGGARAARRLHRGRDSRVVPPSRRRRGADRRRARGAQERVVSGVGGDRKSVV